MEILVTGGAGYIGSHACVALAESGFEPILVDNYSNSKRDVIGRVSELAGRDIKCYNIDLLDSIGIREIFLKHQICGVMHFAGLKAVSESVERPLLYYNNNVAGTVSLLQAMEEFGIRNLIFSSSATVYGDPEMNPIGEGAELKPTNPYGFSKMMIEKMLESLCSPKSYNSNPWRIASLRYFNPIGAHRSGLIGEDPNGIPNNLNPYILKVATGDLRELQIYGSDYPTKDGTGIRDYIHVLDLISGHLSALRWLLLQNEKRNVYEVLNLGTGTGHSVLDMVNEYQSITEKRIKYRFVSRREGDIAECYADVGKAKSLLGWECRFGLSAMIRDSWHWHIENPGGYS